ncbi:transcription factor RFX4 isoform X2 [Tetranychus urticae]|uniref:transcription factor RFX4 isoform X2 n=1 Tax=Tetranychus urticae TaxID=32264 RepID=UPI000D643FDF|nr:transcription factor RFX4 isoform X2 [Tetranychus urticae]
MMSININMPASSSSCLSSPKSNLIDSHWNESNDQPTHGSEAVYEIYNNDNPCSNHNTNSEDDPLNLQGKQQQDNMINSIGSSNGCKNGNENGINNGNGTGVGSNRGGNGSNRNQIDHHSHHSHHNHHHHHHTSYSILRDADSTVVDYGYESTTTTTGVYQSRLNVNHQHHHNHHRNSNVIHSTLDGKRNHSLATIEMKHQQLTPNRSSLRPHSTPATLLWLEENYEIAEGVCIPRSALYMHYVDFCARNCIQPVNAASFGKIIRQQFPQLTTRRLGTRGQSRYHYYGIAVRENSTYYQLAYSKKAITSNNLPDSSRVSDNLNGNKSLSNPSQVNSHSSINNGSSMQNLSPNNNVNLNHGPNGNTNPSNSNNRNRVGTVLPEFPTPNNLKLPSNLDNAKTETFIMMYRTHCQRILDTVIRANFDEIQTFVLYFWQGIPTHLTSILTSNAFINLIGICDSILYKCMASVLLPSALQTFPDSLTQIIRKFTQEFGCWLKVALYNLPDTLKSIKIDLSRHLGNLLRRQTSISHLIQAARMVVNNGDVTPQMICDWRSLSIDLITREAIQSSHRNESINNINLDFIITALRDFGRLLEEESPIETYFDWLNALVQYCIINNSNNLRYTFKENSKQFLSTWSAFASRIIHELSLNSAPSFGSFHLLRLLFDEYLLYIVEYCQIDEYIMELMANINVDLPPQPLEDNYLGETSEDNQESCPSTNCPNYTNEAVSFNSPAGTSDEFRPVEQTNVKNGHEFNRINIISPDNCNYSPPADHYYQGYLIHENGTHLAANMNNHLVNEDPRKSFNCSGDYHGHVTAISRTNENNYSRCGAVEIVEHNFAIGEIQAEPVESVSISSNLPSHVTEDVNFTFCPNLKTEVYTDFC